MIVADHGLHRFYIFSLEEMFRPTASVWTQDKIKEALAGGAQSVTVSKQEMWKTVLWFTVMRLWPMKSSQHSCSFSHGARQEEKDGPRIAIEVTIKQGCLEPQCFQCRKPSDRNPKDKGCAGSNGYHDQNLANMLFISSLPALPDTPRINTHLEVHS